MPRKNYYYYCRLGDKIFYPNYYDYPNYDSFTIYGLMQKGRIVIFEIPLNHSDIVQILSFHILYQDSEREINTSLGWYSHIPPIYNGYYISNNYIIKYIENIIKLWKCDLKNYIVKNLKE